MWRSHGSAGDTKDAVAAKEFYYFVRTTQPHKHHMLPFLGILYGLGLYGYTDYFVLYFRLALLRMPWRTLHKMP